MTDSAEPLGLEGSPPDEGEWEQAPRALRWESDAPWHQASEEIGTGKVEEEASLKTTEVDGREPQ